MSDETRDAEDDKPFTASRRATTACRPTASRSGDEAFPSFDAAAVPPRPPLPVAPDGSAASHVSPLDTADHNAIREQWRAARDELGTHVSHARDQLDQANERIKERTGRDLISPS